MNEISKVFGNRINNESYTDREGAYIIVENNGNIGVVKTPKGYFLIGGGIENNETDEETLIRECLEETGYNTEICGYLGSAETFTFHSKIGYFHPIQHYYFGRLTDKVTEPVESDHSLKWLSASVACEKMYVESQKWAIEKYLEK